MRVLAVILCLLYSMAASAQQNTVSSFESERAQLQLQIEALDAEAGAEQWADLERLQARQAVQALSSSKPRERAEALALARIVLAIADTAVRTEQLQVQLLALEREQKDIRLEASRRDAELARKEAEQLRRQVLAREEEQALAGALAAAAEQQAQADSQALTQAQLKDAQLARLEEEIEAQVKQRGDVLSVRKKSGKSVYVLSASAFMPGKTGLNAEARTSLQQLAKRLKASGKAWRIEGHTDRIGNDEADREFSRLRAEAVLNALRAGGVPGSRLTAVGLGAENAVGNNASKAGRAQNRRIEIIEK